MADYTKAWLSYKMKALTNSKIWNKVTVIADGKENPVPQTVDTAVKELIRTAKDLFGTDIKSERKNVSSSGEECSLAELKTLTGCDEGLVLVYLPALKDTYKEGYRLVVTETAAYIVAGTGRGILYGAFDVIRTEIIEDTLAVCDKKVIPDNPLRMMNHWDNMDNSIERGYSGESFFFVNNEVVVNDRTREYARLCASVGINASVINNVNVKNAATYLITPRYEKELKEMSEIFAEYGVDLYLSLNFAAPMELAGLPVSDPLNEDVRAWWKDTMKNVFTAIPKLAGFLVKADSEGRPGPHTYGRTQAEGANMLAEMVAPFDGKIIWRCFVYNCTQDWRDRKTDRARAGYDHFKPLDGQFADNVVLQIKNGPMDFQIREPISPLLGGLEKTNQILEVQAAQEYTGQQRHFCYLIPMWKEVLDFRTYCAPEKDTVADIVAGRTFVQSACGMAAVTNTGNDENWTGHDFAALNWYGFGRLAFTTSLSAKEIAEEWIKLTVTKDEKAVAALTDMALCSREVYEKYTSPLGIGWMVNPNHHYGPNVDGYEYDRWGTYHRADLHGIGVDRTTKGTGYTTQYREENFKMYEDPATCPEELLLFFHYIRYDYVLKSGKTLIQHIYDTHFEGAEQAEGFLETIKSLKDVIPEDIYKRILPRFEHQAAHSKDWRDIVNSYFYRKSGIEDAKGREIF
ncbi:MAG: alpha-glucuronidase [Lachnospiraceae bacterium]|nr:alpha-glucuronidase [Lachnospiraceae bacterium]